MGNSIQANVPRKSIISPQTFSGWAPLFRCLNSFFTGPIYTIDSSITDHQHVLSRRRQALSHPRRPLIHFHIALDHYHRYPLSNQMEVLDNSIFFFTESILLPPHSWLQHGLLILEALFFLTDALFLRAKVSKQPEDAIYATKYTFSIFEISPMKSPPSHAIKSQHHS
jgi:hypothetical protein